MVNDNAPTPFMITMYIICLVAGCFLVLGGCVQTFFIKKEMTVRGSKHDGFCDKIWEDDM